MDKNLKSNKNQKTSKGTDSKKSVGLNKKDLIADVVKKTKLSNVQVTSVVNHFLGSILDAVTNKKEVTLVGFLSVKFKERKAHMARNPKTGATFMTKAKTAVMIKTGKILQNAVNGK